nr:MAG TPA: intron associated endonuclease [Caudoviricetes sp.]
MQKDTYDEVEYIEIKNPFGFIYITTNLVNGKRYIGQRKFSDGWKPYLGSGKRFKEAVKKYGRENFVRSIVDIAYSREELNAKEINLIKFLNAVDSRNFYNISDGGEIKGKNGKDAYWYNKQLPREIIEKANLKRYKPVYQFDLNGKFIKRYDSVTHAAKENNLSKQGISKSCCDPSKTCGGYFWSYSEDIGSRQYDHTKNHKPDKIYQYDYDGQQLIAIYASAKEASEKTGIDITNIYACCLGRRKHAGKFTWKKESN